jgi:hypothetical protein
MDPVTGLAALAGISLATVAGLRLKKRMEEGFTALPDTTTNYPESIQESQSRYNMFSGLVNPITNSLIPVGSPDTTVKEQKETVNAALGSFAAEFSPNSSQTVVLKKFENQFQARSDTNKGLYGAMKFCRDAGKQSNPFSTYSSDGSLKTQGAVSPDGQWKFDEVCGVCITSGVDEEGNRFRTQQGMVVDPDTRDAAVQEQTTKGWSYPRVGPSIGTCEGAPNAAAFATSAKDLERFKARQACLSNKTLGGADNCGLCFESDSVYSSVPADTQTMPITFLLQGTGTATLQLKGATLAQKQLSESSPTNIELKDAKEGDTFLLTVQDVAGSQTPTNVFGYMFSKTPRDGLYTMPLNLIVTTDDETGASPSKSGGFHNFTDIGLDVAKMRPGSGKTRMRLRGVVPFTFVQPSEFAAMDCLDGPYQTQAASASAFATDQPCYAKGSKPGSYNNACLQQRILDAGCTNAGTLYQNPQQLNTRDGQVQTLTQIYTALQGIAAQDMVDTEATKQCSGREIQTPCDPYIQRAGTLKFGMALQSSNPKVASQAQQCLSFLYHNKGANETANPPRVGPTYTGLVTYRNNQREIKNIYCLPEGQLNPDTNSSARDTLARIGDTGYKGKISVDAIKQYLNDQLSLAADLTRNANTDPDRKAAILNCFGTSLSSLPSAAATNPQRIITPMPVAMPSGYTTGLYVRFFDITDANPDITPGNRGWGGRLGTPNAYARIQFNDWNIARADRCGVVARGYYVAPGPETLTLMTDSDDGIYVSFNNRQVIRNWTIHGPTRDTSAPIQIPAAGIYPFELRFYEWGGGALCTLFYKINDEDTWRTDLGARFGYKPDEVAEEEKKAGEALLPSTFTPTSNTRLGTAINNGDYELSMTIRPYQMVGTWATLVQFTSTGGTVGSTPGDRMPSIWFIPNSFRLHVRIGDMRDGNWGTDTRTACVANTTNQFSIVCQGTSVIVRLNNEVISLTQPSTRPRGLATVWSVLNAGGWLPAGAQITNFRFRTLN